jgi:CHAT domain-containing protein
LLLEVKKNLEESVGNLNVKYAISCLKLANLYGSLDQQKKAELLYLEAKEIFEKKMGKVNSFYADACERLGRVYASQALYSKAKTILLEAKGIWEKISSEHNPGYANTCHSLAVLYINQNLFKQGEPLLIQAKEVFEKTIGKFSKVYASACADMGLLYLSLGLGSKAEPLLVEAKEIFEREAIITDPNYAATYTLLGGLYTVQARYSDAEKVLLKSKLIFEKTVGKSHRLYAENSLLLGGLYSEMEQYKKAESLLLEVLEFYEKSVGKLHVDYAYACGSLGVLYVEQGLYTKAEPLLLEAKEITEKALSKHNKSYSNSCNDLAYLFWTQGQYAKAEPLLLEAHQTYFSLIDNQFAHLSEKEKEAFLNTFNYYFQFFNSFVLQRKQDNPAIVANMYNNLLATKALLFNAQNKIRGNILASNNPALIQSFENWQAKRNFLAKAYQMTLEEKQKKNIDTKLLEDEANTLEKQLSAQSEAFAQANDKKRYTWKDVQQALKPRQAAIEMVRFEWINKEWTDTVYYAALIVTPASKLPELVLFENGKELERYCAFYKNHIAGKLEDTQSYNQFWKPMADRLKAISPKTNKVFFSADGVYHSINLQTLLNPQTGRYLADEWDVQLVTSTKDLVATKKKTNPAKEASLFGYPDYGTKSKADSTRGFDIGYAIPKTDSLKRDFADGQISMLPGTEKEINELQKSMAQKNWKTATYKLGQANENSLKAQRNPTVLHIATHGFFMKDVESDKRGRGFAGFDNRKVFENPLLRSGLLLAGSQQAFDGKTNLNEEDGILTAYEAMNLNLDNTDLVVLSACETGLGEVRNGEGVFGLQRAFQTAGAKSIVMSLWKVDDNATQELMQLFYGHWLATGNKRNAFKQAQTDMKTKYKHPFYWGAFVMVGE